jgi:hypothetical protein
VSGKHTPAPWSYTEGEYPNIYLSDGGDPLDGSELGAEEATANARLIAAAPDLLKALQAAIDCGLIPASSAKEGGAMPHSRQVQVADLVRAAIAKATTP